MSEVLISKAILRFRKFTLEYVQFSQLIIRTKIFAKQTSFAKMFKIVMGQVCFRVTIILMKNIFETV